MQKIKMNCLSLLYFWCNQDRVGDTELFVDFIGKIVKPPSLVLFFCGNGALWVVTCKCLSSLSLMMSTL